MIAIVIVNYGTKDHVKALLSLLVREAPVARIIIVDNADDFRFEQENLPDVVEIIFPGENLGFARAVNLAAQRIREPYLLVINPDVRPLAGSIESLLETAQRTEAALVGPRFYWDEERRFRLPPAEGEVLFWHFSKQVGQDSYLDGEVLSYYWRVRHVRFWEAKEPFFEPFLSGACLLINRKYFPKEIFDPRFFLYYEDTDLCLHVLKEGGLLLCDPKAEMIHFWNQSPDPPEGKASLMIYSQTKFFEKYYGKKPIAFFEKRFKDPIKEDYENLGSYVSSPEISVPVSGFLEIGLNPLLIPFAQTEVKKGCFVFPKSIWTNMPKGKYFLRVCKRNGYIAVRYTFEKK